MSKKLVVVLSAAVFMAACGNSGETKAPENKDTTAAATTAPAAASDDQTFLFNGFGDEIGLVFDQLRIQAKGMAECSIELRGRIIVLLEPADG